MPCESNLIYESRIFSSPSLPVQNGPVCRSRETSSTCRGVERNDWSSNPADSGKAQSKRSRAEYVGELRVDLRVRRERLAKRAVRQAEVALESAGGKNRKGIVALMEKAIPEERKKKYVDGRRSTFLPRRLTNCRSTLGRKEISLSTIREGRYFPRFACGVYFPSFISRKCLNEVNSTRRIFRNAERSDRISRKREP